MRFASTRVRPVGDGLLHVEGDLEAAGKLVPLEFEAALHPRADGLHVEATTTVDQRRLGMSTGRLGMIRPPVTLHVECRLREAYGSSSKAA